MSASVYASYEDLSVKLEHKFYAKSVLLFDIIRKYVSKRIGIITFTIETQAVGVIANAVASELEEKLENIETPEIRAKMFESHSVFFDQCLSHLNDNLSVLQREPVSSDERDKCYPAVSQMYNKLQEQANKLDINEIINANIPDEKYRKIIRWELQAQYKKKYKQLLKLKNEPVEESDKRILCEAISLLCIYTKTNKNTRMYLASTDYHFSPSNDEGEITDEIEKRFKIICHWPDKIAKFLKSDGFT